MKFRLKEKLLAYSGTDALPMHMPGHKRNPRVFDIGAAELLDITEIDGFDDLHDPEGILKESQEAAAALYGADRSFYLVNGTTAGVLAAVTACAAQGGSILMARNSHLCVYNAVIVNGLKPEYIVPQVHPQYGIAAGITPEAVRRALAVCKNGAPAHRAEIVSSGIDSPACRAEKTEAGDGSPASRKKTDPPSGFPCAVVITSPTYEGVISDIRGIAGVCHEYGIPLIVDEAHGAHLKTESEINGSNTGTDTGFPAGALACGADVVINSLHKTMPAPTQTGILHCRGSLADPERIKRALDIFQTSSPSYILMAGIENALAYRSADGWHLHWEQALAAFYKKTKSLKALKILPPGGDALLFDRDPSKIVIMSGAAGMNGSTLMALLRDHYSIEAEMAAGSYVIAMTGAGDTPESLNRLADALLDIDRKLTAKASFTPAKKLSEEMLLFGEAARPGIPRYAMNPREAFYAPCETVGINDACGRISHDIITVYPPGIPVLAPGEMIGAAAVEIIENAENMGLRVTGKDGADGDMLRVCAQPCSAAGHG